MQDTVLFIFKNDFRLHDNPALYEASKHSDVTIGYIYDEDIKVGSARKWWLHQALNDMEKNLEQLNGRLIIRKGDFEAELMKLLHDTNAHSVYWNHIYEPNILKRDQKIVEKLKELGVKVKTYNSTLLIDPGTITTNQNEPYKVFTPFYRRYLTDHIPMPYPTIQRTFNSNTLSSISIEELNLLPKIPWSTKFEKVWNPTEEGGLQQLDSFISVKLDEYEDNRDFPFKSSTSNLSPFLANGQISARTIFHTLNNGVKTYHHSAAFIRQLIWRDFSYNLLLNFPHTIDQPLNHRFHSFEWNDDPVAFQQWYRGKTGYPIVDAGMNELWETGIMHNRVRMIVASFLTKHLLIPWRKGATWFEDTLMDADLANNTFGWQWTAGTGADAAPYFRIFNPILQGQKFDPEGIYIKKWLPHLKELPAKYIHEPWKAPAEILQKSGIVLDQNYPMPLVDHKSARLRALSRYNEIK